MTKITIIMGSESDLETKWIKKVYLGIISIVLLGVCLVMPAYLFGQEKNIKNSEENNAAVYYSKAFDLLIYPRTGEPAFNKLKEIIERGWQGESKEAEKILEENEPCLNELKKGLLLKKCDFTFGEECKYLSVKKIPNLLKTRDASNLLLLNGRYYERQKNFTKAIDFYLSSLTFAQHISQDNSLISKMLGLVIEKETYIPFSGYLNSKETNKELLKKILVYLEDYEKQHFPGKELVEAEKELFISNIQLIIDGALKKVTEDKKEESKLNEEMKRKWEDFISQILEQGNELADRYYGNFIKAAQTNNKEDLSFAIGEVERVKKDEQLQNTEEEIFVTSDILKDAFAGKIEELNKKLAHRIAISVLVVSMPNFEKALDTYKSILKELEELKSLAKVKMDE